MLRNELTYDRHNVNYERIYRVVNEFTIHDKLDRFAATSASLGPMLGEQFADVQAYVRFQSVGERLIRALAEGRSVALVTDAGTPGISDPGFLLVRAAREAGIPVVPVPGPSAVTTALSAAGVPADRFVFDGFLPVKPGRRRHRLEALRALDMTIVCYESPHRILATLEAVAEVFGEAELVVARELTKQFEEIAHGTARALRDRFAAGPVRGEFTLVIPRVRAAAGEAEIDP